MPYQVLPGLVIISLAFTLTGVGFGAINKRIARKEHQVRGPRLGTFCVSPPRAEELTLALHVFVCVFVPRRRASCSC
jgi:hypothetical protein